MAAAVVEVEGAGRQTSGEATIVSEDPDRLPLIMLSALRVIQELPEEAPPAVLEELEVQEIRVSVALVIPVLQVVLVVRVLSEVTETLAQGRAQVLQVALEQTEIQETMEPELQPEVQVMLEQTEMLERMELEQTQALLETQE